MPKAGTARGEANKMNELDDLVLDIVGKDSPAVLGLLVEETWVVESQGENTSFPDASSSHYQEQIPERQTKKIVGERKVNAVLEVETPEQADALSIDLPLMKEFGDQVQIEVTPLVVYESLANDLNQRLNIDVSQSAADPTTTDGIFYWLRLTLNYDGMSQEELFRLWTEEAAAAIGTNKSGRVVDVWKAVAKREIHALLCVNSPEDVDKLSFDLPMMKNVGERVTIACKSLRSYQGFYEDMKRRLSETDLASK